MCTTVHYLLKYLGMYISSILRCVRATQRPSDLTTYSTYHLVTVVLWWCMVVRAMGTIVRYEKLIWWDVRRQSRSNWTVCNG